MKIHCKLRIPVISTLCSRVLEEKNIRVGSEISNHYLGQLPDHSNTSFAFFFSPHPTHIRPSWSWGPAGISICQGSGPKDYFPAALDVGFHTCIESL